MIYIKIQVVDFQNAYDFAILEERPDGLYIAKPVQFEMTKVDDNSRRTFRLSRGVAESLIKELRGAGAPDPAESRLQGKLEATEYHLADMRQLLKLKDYFTERQK